MRPLEILTGGNPRLLAIIALFGAGRSFRELMDNLLDLVDDHTEYFKSHLESLPALEAPGLPLPGQVVETRYRERGC